jgi:hypothetical protein
MDSPIPRISILDHSNVSWQTINEEFNRRIPLTSLVWNNPLPGRSPQRLDYLDIHIQTHQEAVAATPLLNTSLSPYLLHMYITNCDESEEYKLTEKKRIQDWIAAMSTTRKGLVEDLINVFRIALLCMFRVRKRSALNFLAALFMTRSRYPITSLLFFLV